MNKCLTLTSSSSQYPNEPFGYQVAADIGYFYYSSGGEFGFYPWIDSTKSYYGIIAHHQASSAYSTIECGRLIRAAFMTGVEQTGTLPTN